MATLNRFGNAYQYVPLAQFTAVAQECEHPVILANLCTMVREFGLKDEEGFRLLLSATAAAARR
ncbi:hypothetical protein AB0I66_42735 [Streptomyces sp. NPDC050439]|uniref:hypothetical protein n=1 Tax=unclassified Streptomyces TaxID=2593676 RepID=UPI00342D1CB1